MTAGFAHMLRIAVHGLGRLTTTPEGRMSQALRRHWLAGIECNHELRTDVANCAYGDWQSEPQPTVGDAVGAWINHVMEKARALDAEEK